MDIHVKRCGECGALVVENWTTEETYCCKEKDFDKFFPDYDLDDVLEESQYAGCDYCVNKWGLDLCACGSGKHYLECDEGFDCCGQPMSIIGERINFISEDAWTGDNHE